jgi:hypothetical protein
MVVRFTPEALRMRVCVCVYVGVCAYACAHANMHVHVKSRPTLFQDSPVTRQTWR